MRKVMLKSTILKSDRLDSSSNFERKENLHLQLCVLLGVCFKKLIEKCYFAQFWGELMRHWNKPIRGSVGDGRSWTLTKGGLINRWFCGVCWLLSYTHIGNLICFWVLLNPKVQFVWLVELLLSMFEVKQTSLEDWTTPGEQTHHNKDGSNAPLLALES